MVHSIMEMLWIKLINFFSVNFVYFGIDVQNYTPFIAFFCSLWPGAQESLDQVAESDLMVNYAPVPPMHNA